MRVCAPTSAINAMLRVVNIVLSATNTTPLISFWVLVKACIFFGGGGVYFFHFFSSLKRTKMVIETESAWKVLKFCLSKSVWTLLIWLVRILLCSQVIPRCVCVLHCCSGFQKWPREQTSWFITHGKSFDETGVKNGWRWQWAERKIDDENSSQFIWKNMKLCVMILYFSVHFWSEIRALECTRFASRFQNFPEGHAPEPP